MRYRLSRHTMEEMERRGISRELLDSVLLSPGQTVLGKDGTTIFQSLAQFSDSRSFLIRAVVNSDVDPAVVVTVYRTSKIDKYWRQS